MTAILPLGHSSVLYRDGLILQLDRLSGDDHHPQAVSYYYYKSLFA
jgi:hypothetical protein